MPAKPSAELTLRDRLSRLNCVQACKLRGPEGRRLIQAGGKQGIDVDACQFPGDDLLQVTLPGAVGTITLMAEARQRLRWDCTACRGPGEHGGAGPPLGW